MNSAERAARLSLVHVDDIRPPPGVGGWGWRVLGREVQLRNKRLPHLRLDLTVTEAHDLIDTLILAVDEHAARPVVRASLWGRFVDWLARNSWRRKHAFEQAEAMRLLAEEFAEKGGW